MKSVTYLLDEYTLLHNFWRSAINFKSEDDCLGV